MLYLFLKLAPACLCATIGICYLRYWSNLLLLWDKQFYKIIDFYVIFVCVCVFFFFLQFHQQMENADFDSSTAVLTPEQIQEVRKRMK